MTTDDARALKELSALLRVELTDTHGMHSALIPSLLGVARRSAWDGNCLVGGREGHYRCIGARSGSLGYDLRENAHRAVVLLTHGTLGLGIVARHTCDRMNCIAPLHLIPGTVSQNVRDSVDRHRLSTIKAHGESSGRALLTDRDVCRLRESAREGRSIQAIANEYPNISYGAVWAAIRGLSWTHLDVPPLERKKRSSPNRDFSNPEVEAARGVILRMSADGVGHLGIASALGLPRSSVRKILLGCAA